MSLLAEIYVSRDADAVRYDTAPEQFADRSQHKGFGPVELSILWSIMQNVEWDVPMLDEFPCLLQISGGERLIHRIPQAMITELAELSPDRVALVTSAWAAIEELNCSPEDIRPVVDDLVHLARLATEMNRGLYLWNCI
jgi:hypothetical protein